MRRRVVPVNRPVKDWLVFALRLASMLMAVGSLFPAWDTRLWLIGAAVFGWVVADTAEREL